VKIEKSRQNASGVSFDDWDCLIEGKAGDGVRGIFPDPRELLHFPHRSWEPSAILSCDGPRCGVKISCARVIAEALPGAQDVIFRSASQRSEIGKSTEPLLVIRSDSGYLSLLEHELGDEDGVWVARSAPEEVAPVTAIPAEKRTLKRANVLWRWHHLTANVQRATPHVQLSIQKLIEY